MLLMCAQLKVNVDYGLSSSKTDWKYEELWYFFWSSTALGHHPLSLNGEKEPV